MNILVTGAGGFLGKRLAEHLTEEHTVYGLIHDKAPWPNKWRPAPRSAWGWTPLAGDIKDYPRMLEIMVDEEIEQVYHLAAKSIVRNCKSDPLGCLQANVIGTANILEAARHSDTVQGVMCAESDKAYGVGLTPYVESQALMPGSIYEASKACVTHLANAYSRNYCVPVFTVRSANVYGPGDDNATRLIPGIIMRVLRGDRPHITTGAATFIREFFYVDNFVSVAIDLMETEPWGETFNVGSGETMSVGDVIKLICELVGTSMIAEEWDRPIGLLEITNQSLCLDKLNQVLPDRQTMPLRDGLQRTIEWYKKQSRLT